MAAAYSTGQSSQPPVIQAQRDSTRIIHRELIASVVGSTAFTVANTFALNPGVAATFPWLSTQAQSWETYRFNKLRFCAYTRTGSQVPGSLMLVPDYDAADAAPSTEQLASSYEDASEDVPWKDIHCELRPAAMHSMGPKKFIRTGPLAANLDVKTYDCGQLFVCTVDGTAVNWSKLWVEYDITMYTPTLFPPALIAIQQSEKIVAAGGGIANSEVYGAAPIHTGNIAIATAAFNTITFNQIGQWLVEWFFTGTLTIMGSAGGTVTQVDAATTVGNGTNAVKSVIVTVTAPGATLIMSGPTGTVTATVVRIAPYLASLA